ncbi:HEAT repeat domain-containing protein [bacterium]|nr:HEAT repeat domain-containing protein [bacterium]MBU1152538.1 HEAT repeat domain-containing protein [bacterium]
MANKEIKVNKRMVFNLALRRFKVIFTTVTIISLIFAFISGVGYSETDRVDELIQELKDEDSDVRENAAKALGEIKDARAVEPLIAALKGGEDPCVRWNAARALEKIGTPAVEPLIAALKDEDSSVRVNAEFSLGRIGTPAAEPLIAALKDKDPIVQHYAARGTGKDRHSCS